MRSNLISHGAAFVAMVAASACSTLNDQAPAEFHEAREAIEDAQSVDVDDQMPRAMEAAERKYARAVDLLDESGNRMASGDTAEGESLRKAAIEQAVAARDIAKGSVDIVHGVESYDANLGNFFAMEGQAAEAQKLAGENTSLKEQNAALQAKVDELTKSNAALANRPIESEIPADFRVAKPIAYFSSGSSTLNANARADIEELANFLKTDEKFTVTLEGFADPRGSAELNRKLAEKRVAAVAAEIIRLGVEAKRIGQNPVGETEETATGNQGAMQLDRKVVAKVSVAH